LILYQKCNRKLFSRLNNKERKARDNEKKEDFNSCEKKKMRDDFLVHWILFYFCDIEKKSVKVEKKLKNEVLQKLVYVIGIEPAISKCNCTILN
jgi:hypothetical protein